MQMCESLPDHTKYKVGPFMSSELNSSIEQYYAPYVVNPYSHRLQIQFASHQEFHNNVGEI